MDTIEFQKSHDHPNGMTSGTLVLKDSAVEQKFLGELNDVHPDFATHIVAAVNLYNAIKEVIIRQGTDGALVKALSDVLKNGV